MDLPDSFRIDVIAVVNTATTTIICQAYHPTQDGFYVIPYIDWLHGQSPNQF
jgi:hypothetical protein